VGDVETLDSGRGNTHKGGQTGSNNTKRLHVVWILDLQDELDDLFQKRLQMVRSLYLLGSADSDL
jgi:hypothetical protein